MTASRILLIGIGGVYNYGCEAIVRGTERILRASWPDVKIVYASQRVEDDKKRLANCAVEVIARKGRPRYSPQNITRKLLNLAGIAWYFPSDSPDICDGYDAVLSIGGDIYTVKPNGSGNRGFLRFGDECEKRGVPYVLWGASVGPFIKNSETERAFVKHLNTISLITAREPVTIEYLHSLGVRENTVSCADPAFVVAPNIVTQITGQSDTLTIGINLSPLSVMHTGLPVQDTVATQARTIQKIIEKFKAKILLIPHVICNFAKEDDDLRYLQKVQAAIASEYQSKVKLFDTDPGFVTTKQELAKCDLVIAARMHCAINALSAHVPTIFISYSRKSAGMSQYVYGSNEWVIPLDEFASDSFLQMISTGLDQRENTRRYLTGRIPDIQQAAYLSAQYLRERILTNSVG